MGREKRTSARHPVPMGIEVRSQEQGVVVLETTDISDGGAFIKAPPEQCLPVGSEIELKVKGLMGGDAPLVKARVVRLSPQGMGVEFIRN